MIQEKKVYVEGIPCLQITSGEMPKGVVLFYHGWSSQKNIRLYGDMCWLRMGMMC